MAAGGRREEDCVVPSSEESKRAINTIRLSMERDFLAPMAQRDQSMELINLSAGNPAVFGNLPPHHQGLCVGFSWGDLCQNILYSVRS